MSEGPLAGLGVLVTRPEQQSAGLKSAIEAAGGHCILFPVIEIVPRSPQAIETAVGRLTAPDIVVFVSRNAVEYGLVWAGGGAIAVVGPATAAAVEAAGSDVDIAPSSGYDSEGLLAEAPLNDVRGKTIRIVRGNGGRELLADTLRARGAIVEYLQVYTRRAPEHPDADIADLARHWRDGDIDIVTVMSVESLRNLLSLLPDSCRDRLAGTPLVTPAARVIKEAMDRLPGCPATLAAGPAPDDMVRAMAAIGPQRFGQHS